MNLKRLMQIPKARLLKKLLGFDEIFTVALREGADGALLREAERPFMPIAYSSKYWYADPITFCHEGKEYLFVEEYDRDTLKGQLAAAVLEPNGGNVAFHTILQEPYHLSYPMVFPWQDGIYMIPETSENKSINLYQAEAFPYQWRLVQAFDVGRELVDTVVLEKSDGALTLLTSEVSPENPLLVRFRKLVLKKDRDAVSLELLPEGEAAPYDLHSRTAGKIFEDGGRRILPTQRSTAVDYGHSLCFSELTDGKMKQLRTLGPADVEIADIPANNRIGIHTYCCTGSVEVIDVRYLKFAPVNQMKKMLRKSR